MVEDISLFSWKCFNSRTGNRGVQSMTDTCIQSLIDYNCVPQALLESFFTLNCPKGTITNLLQLLYNARELRLSSEREAHLREENP